MICPGGEPARAMAPLCVGCGAHECQAAVGVYLRQRPLHPYVGERQGTENGLRSLRKGARAFLRSSHLMEPDVTDILTYDRAALIETQLTARFGAVICGGDLRTLLGYRTGDAFRHAVYRGSLPVPSFFIPGRRGRCATARVVAQWLANLDARAHDENHESIAAPPSPHRQVGDR